MTPARPSAKVDPWLTAALVVSAIATVLPIWIARYLPLLDLPNHLTAVAVWHYHDDPNWDFARFYDLNLVPLPYWAHYYTVHLLTYVTRSVETANKIFLTGYAVALPAGALLLARRFGRSPWLALFAFPLVWNFNLGDGFIAYCAGFAAVPLALVVVDRHAVAPTWERALAVVAAGTLTYFFHLLAYALFLVCAGLVVLAQRRALAPKLLAARALPVLSCAAIGAWALRRANDMNFHRVTGVGRQLVYDPLSERLAQIPDRLINFLPGRVDELVLIVAVACWLALAVTAARTRCDDDRDGRALPPHVWGPELCLAGALALYLLSPRSMQRPFYWHMINGRFVVAIALFAALTLRGAIAGWRRLLLAPVVVATVIYAIALCGAFREFNRHAAGFDEVVAQIPRGKQVLTLILRPMGDSTVNVSAFNQWPSYVQLRHGGYNFYNFAEGFPLRYRVLYPAPAWSHAEGFDWKAHARPYDYFLTFREGWEYSPMKQPLADGVVRLVAHEGEWRLYEKLAPVD
ncbi:MAG: hypothetical protein JWM53_1647 [bacterium]|nr:hypothetical protein [bacterium]